MIYVNKLSTFFMPILRIVWIRYAQLALLVETDLISFSVLGPFLWYSFSQKYYTDKFVRISKVFN
ncbi:hypothetical protein STAPHY8AQ_70203 [Staphylococcus sp. 8AQ]|nr:hypothetical protein STAPHY8AQ_70203 [Staphylococcus sp. 8AQ]